MAARARPVDVTDTKRRYLALCPNCGNERELSRMVVATGKIPVCDTDNCGRYMNVYPLDPRSPREVEGNNQ